MKLVEILAKEMHEWPEMTEGGTRLEQDINNSVIEGDGCGTYDLFMLSQRADDYSENPHITRAQWQAERDRQKGGEWKRHRGGKQPVFEGKVEVKFRDGDIEEWFSHSLDWSHNGKGRDIMQYRIISQPQAEEVDVIKVDPTIAANVEVFNGQWITDQIDGPIKWRDTIIHCQAIIEDCEREIQRNVDLLDAEGLMMQTDSKKSMQHYDALQVDPKDWQIGDILEITKRSDAYSHDFKLGEHVKVDYFDLDDEDLPVRCYALDDSDYWYIKYDEAKFVRRP